MRTATITHSGSFGDVGKSVRLFEGFLQKRRLVEQRLVEAGITDSQLHAWRNPENSRFRQRDMEASLREAGVDDRDECIKIQEANVGAGEFNEVGITRLEDLLLESASTSDFGAYLSDKATKRLMWGYTEEASSWRQYARIFSVPDFKPISFVRLNEMADWLPVPEGGPYHDQPLDELAGPEVTVGTFGRTFTITRPAIINDDLNQLRERPAAMGRACVRTMSKDIVGLLVSNPNAYDGTPTFSVGHKNLISGTLDETNVGRLVTGLRVQTDTNGNRMGLRPQALIIPPELELRAMVIVNSTTVPLAGFYQGQGAVAPPTTPLPHGVGGANVIAAVVRKMVIETYLTDPASYYMIADPNQAPGLAMGFLNGKQTPDVFLRDPGMRNVLGTSDPYDMPFDEVAWKGRHDWGTAILDWRGLQKSAN